MVSLLTQNKPAMKQWVLFDAYFFTTFIMFLEFFHHFLGFDFKQNTKSYVNHKKLFTQ